MGDIQKVRLVRVSKEEVGTCSMCGTKIKREFWLSFDGAEPCPVGCDCAAMALNWYGGEKALRKAADDGVYPEPFNPSAQYACHTILLRGRSLYSVEIAQLPLVRSIGQFVAVPECAAREFHGACELAKTPYRKEVDGLHGRVRPGNEFKAAMMEIEERYFGEPMRILLSRSSTI